MRLGDHFQKCPGKSQRIYFQHTMSSIPCAGSNGVHFVLARKPGETFRLGSVRSPMLLNGYYPQGRDTL